MSLDDSTLIEHILEQCRRICRLTEKISFEEFQEEPIYQDALTRELEIIGEAAGNLSAEFCDMYPQIPVSVMRGLRNILAHQYFAVDLKTVWTIAQNDVPSLLKTIEECALK